MPIKINSTGGGSVSIDVPSTGGTYTLTAPANNATIFTTAGGAITGNVAFTSNNVSIGGSSISAFGGKNRIINGDFRIWQRSNGAATSVTSNGVGYTGPDRFFLYQNNASPGVQSVQVSGPTGFQYALKWGRPSGNTKTDITVMGQTIESRNCADLAGKTITLSFWAKAGSNFSSSANAVYTAVYSGTGTDDSAANMTTATWAGSATPISTTTTLTTTWQKFSYTATLGSSVAQIGLYMNWVPTGTAGSDDYVYITGIQIEEGATSTPFEFRSYGNELALCHRYCSVITRTTAEASAGNWDVFAMGSVWSGGYGIYRVQHPMLMRASPTATFTSAGTFGHHIPGYSGNQFTNIYAQATTKEASMIVGVYSGSLTTGLASYLVVNSSSASATMTLTAEL